MNKKIIFFCLSLCMLFLQTAFAASGDRAEYKVSYFNSTVIEKTAKAPQVLRIEIGLSQASESFSVHADKLNPNDLIIELDKTKLSKIKQSIQLDGKLAQRIQFTQLGRANSRAVITLSRSVEKVNYKVYTLPKDRSAKKPFRIVVDIIDGDRFAFTAGLKGKRIVLDPGHGGSDPGAIGPNGVMEKEVALDVSMKVEELLKQAGAEVVMTRRDDRDVYGRNATASQELQARVDVGRKNPADLFLSIHANSFVKPTAHGTATYYYAKTRYDGMLAEALQNGMVEYGELYDRGKVEANFYVVKRSDMPAVLLEMAFISNPEEERLLNSEEFQQKLAQGICKGLSEFFMQAQG